MELDRGPVALDLPAPGAPHQHKEKVNFPALGVFLSLGNGRGRRSPTNLKLPHDVSSVNDWDWELRYLLV